MRRGFFKPGEVGQQRASLNVIRQPGCAACGLHKGCLSPKMPVHGQGARKILVVGEAPGENEDYQGKPFVGKSGEMLKTALGRNQVGLFQDCWVTNSLRCRPKRNKLPKDPKKLIEHCRPYLLTAIKELQPEVIILLGGVPVQSLIGWLWKEDMKGIMRWAGWQIPSTRLNAWVCPTYHPSYVGRERSKDGQVVEALFQTHIDAACALSGRPYPDGPPDLRKAVKCIHNPDEAADLIHRLIDAHRPVAFDYETDRLKPDHPNARIVCCSVSDGTVSVAFPWHGAAVRAMKELLTSDIPKVGFNVKFEECWTRRALGIRVCNWVFDGMLAAHVIDNRPGTKSLKFQAFVRMGADSYDDEIKPYLMADDGNQRNRITELSLSKLLLYCGVDSLYESRLAAMLAPQLGVEL